MEDGEKIAAMLAVKEFQEDKFFVMGSLRGVVEEDRALGLQQPAGGRHHRDGRRGTATR
jgi:hypothetical protein